MPAARGAPDPILLAADIIDPPRHPHEHDPVGWITTTLGDHLWTRQRKIAEAVRDHRKVAVPACHSSGKSWLAARIIAWWLDVHPPGTARVVSTAPTAPQVRTILWGEIADAYAAGKLRGRVNQTEWWMHPDGTRYTTARPGERQVGVGRKPADANQAAFQGIHAEHILVVIDEADGIAPNIWEAVESLASNEGGKLLALANPVDPTSQFARYIEPPPLVDLERLLDDPDWDYTYDTSAGWHVIGIDGLRTPNFTGEPVPDALRQMLIGAVYEQEMRVKHGRGGAGYIGRVRGRHPIDVEDGVVRRSDIIACRHVDDDGQPIPAGELWTAEQLLPVELGVDVGAGGDESVIRERRGVRAGRVWRQRNPDTMQLVELVLQAIRETGATAVKVDTIGIGKGAGDRLAQLGTDQARIDEPDRAHRARVVPVDVGITALDPQQYPKLRDQLWWEIGRELTEGRAVDLSELDEETISQLIAPRLLPPDAANRTKVEPKVETKKRIGRSPDDADALLLAYLHLPPLGDQVVEYYEPETISTY